MKRILSLTLALILSLSLTACGGPTAGSGSNPSGSGTGSDTSQPGGDTSGTGAEEPGDEAVFIDQVDLGVEEEFIYDEAVALAASPVAISTMLKPEASGTAVEENAKAVIDYSNVKDGYIMVKFIGDTTKAIKVKLTGNGTDYVYNLPSDGQWQTFPLPCGNGEYTIKVLENTEGNKFAVVMTQTLEVTLSDEFAPFIRPNQYVNYENAVSTIAKAQELIGNDTDVLVKVQKVYDYVVGGMVYDKQKAATVQAGYLPVLDDVLAAKTGICFDYAALMAGMLRSQGVPCKLVVGYVPVGCHAWISVYSPETGWIENTVYFDGKTWQRMDPTFASSSNNSPEILQYIGDGSNYDAKYFY